MADWLRRRMRRMALARPVTAVVVERVIMGTGIAFSLRRDDVMGRRLQPVRLIRSGRPMLGGRSEGVGSAIGAGASVTFEALDRAIRVVR